MPPKEFTPEITEAFFQRLAGGIRKRGERARGLARSEALARGVTGDPIEGSLVGQARAETARGLGGLEADIGFRVAGLQREERIGTERREDIQAFESSEAALERAFREKMGRLGFELKGQAEKTTMRRGFQEDLLRSGISAGTQLISRGVGKFLGG